MKVIYLGAGTFWLTEAVYKNVIGVTEVTPGYMGGELPNPTFEIVATGNTGHVEVVKILYDENSISTEILLRIFYTLHDPTSAQHVSYGIGSQYRPVIFYTDSREAEAADPENGEDVGIIPRVIEEIQARLPEGVIVTTHSMNAKEFYPAEEYHHNYFQRNPDSAHSIEVIAPTLELVRNTFPTYFI